MRKKWISLILLFTGSIFNTLAQQPSIRNFTTNIYGGGTQNWCVSQSDDKRMLFANNNGLLSYDSEKWATYNIANNTIVRSIYYDKKHDCIYAGASNEFGYYFLDSITYQPTYRSLSDKLPQNERSFDEVWNIYKYNNAIAFQCKKHIFLLKPSGKFKIFHTKYRIESSAVINDKIIITCKETIYYILNNQLHIMNNTNVLRGKSIRAIIPYLNGKIIFATASHGLYVYDGFTISPLTLDISSFLKKNQVFCGAMHGNMLAFGTVRGGLVVKNIKTGQNLYANVFTGLQNNTVLSLFFDDQNNIWLGLDQGISYVLTDAPFKEIFGHNNQTGTGYASLIFKDRFYIGTNQGLFSTAYPMQDIPIPEQPKLVPNMTGQVWSIRNVSETVLCGNNEGAYQIEGTNARKISGTEGTWDFKILQQHPGYVLSCDYQGLYILKKVGDKWIFRNRIAGFNETSAVFEESSDGSIWISHWQKGVYHLWLTNDLTRVKKMTFYNEKEGLPTSENNIISKINGKVYISSVDGFYSANSETGKLHKAKKLNSIFQSLTNPMKLFETPMHDIWAVNANCLAIAKQNSMGKYKTDAFTYCSIAKRLQKNLGHISFVDKKHTIFNVENGFISINNDYKGRKNNAQILIRQIIGTNSGDTILYVGQSSTAPENIQLTHNQNSIKIEYVWPEYSSENAILFSYFLENYDNQWSRYQNASSKEYTRIGKGTYVFHIRGYNKSNGLVQEKKINITILPAWYETWVAYSIYLIILLFVLYFIVKYVRYRYDRKIQMIEMHRERQLREREAQLEIERQKKEKELIQTKNNQLQTELKHKTSLLADSTMNLIRKNDMLQILDTDLTEISTYVTQQETKHRITRKIQNVRRNIQTNIREDENWEKFEENFSLVYTDYMKKLSVRFPNLKMNDRKLCAYLRMGLSSKEMASLLNTSVRSIETARYRLRKKLNLQHDNNLSDFIQSL